MVMNHNKYVIIRKFIKSKFPKLFNLISFLKRKLVKRFKIMCGILGQIKFNSNDKLNKKLFVESLNLLKHRGPDDSDLYFNKKFIFGHRRLSIIDLDSNSRQPPTSICKISL